LALWTLASNAATVFKVVENSCEETIQSLYGALSAILVSDRAKALNFWVMRHRQICRTHLIRKFASVFERDGPAAPLGRQLLDYAGLVFDDWHAYKASKPRTHPIT
jgi:hypothetical protein